MLKLERVDAARVDWEALDARPDRVVFQTREWLAFLEATQEAEPIVAAVLDGATVVGWFTGLVVKRFGVSILGSPFPGWTTASMGFNLDEGVPRREAAAALPRFAFRELGCLHLELKDRELTETLDGFEWTETLTYEIDLESDDDELLSRFNSMARRNVRAAAKNGVVVEEAAGIEFADEYYAQLVDVFAKQGLRPTYGVGRVRELIRHVHPTGRLLLLRARAGDGESVATAILPAMNRAAYFWGGASWREHQKLRPNEAVFWHAMRYWRDRNIPTLDTAGGGEYKLKYGPRNEVRVPHFRRARVPGLLSLRGIAQRAVARRQRVAS